MMAIEIIEKAVGQVTGFFEKATEMRFFAHLTCLLSYLDLGLFLSTRKALPALAWNDFGHVSPGELGFLVVGYFFLMGYIFRITHAVFSWSIGWLGNEFGSTKKTGWGDVTGMVHEDAVLKKAYESTNHHDLTRMLEAEKKEHQKDAKEFRELGYISFTALVLVLCNYWFVPAGIANQCDEFFIGLLGSRVGHSLSVLLLVPFAWVALAAITSDYDRENYLKHQPLYAEIEDEKRKEREKNGILAALPVVP